MKLLPPAVRAVLLDIEGTVGDIQFVQRALFPYARERFAAYIDEHRSEIPGLLEETARLAGISATDDAAIIRALQELSDANVKAPPLKELQGLIWRAGYQQGELRAHLYDDVAPALRALHQRGLVLAIYSSGSVLAQKLYFAHSTAGDLTPLLSGYFDTSSGPKASPASYRQIASALALPIESICFFSDASAEIAAAREAGMQAVRVDRTRLPGESGRDAAGSEWRGSLSEL